VDLSDPASFTPDDSPLGLDDIVASPEYLDLMTPKLAVGDDAVDFTLPVLGGESTFTLSAVACNQPVALIFGSYT
jgi:hypothetical protein